MQLRIPLLFISAISLFGGLWHGQYIYDGYHWGFIFTNALELINGHKPYSEIFLEYGFLTVFINAITLKLFSNDVYSLIFLTCLVYSLSLYFIGIITYTITENKFYSIFASSILLVLYPWPTTPWANFYSFFFTIIFCFFYLKEKKIFHYSAGLSLALAYLCLTTVYNLVIGLFAISSLLYMSKFENKKKLLKTFLSFLTIILLFFIYLKYNELLSIWYQYQKIPFLAEASYFNEGNKLYTLLLRYIYFLTINPIKNFILEPQWAVYAVLFYSNIVIIILLTFNFLNNRNLKFYDEILVINLLIFTLNIYAQILGIEKLATSLALGSVSLALLLVNIKSDENKFILTFCVAFICLYSLFFTYNLESSKIAGLRTAHLKELLNLDSKIKNNQFKYFKNQKWNEERWKTIDKLINIQKSIIKKCDIEYGANLTTNNFFHALIVNEKKQIMPWYEKKMEVIKSFVEPNWIKDLQYEVDNNNIIIISTKNNHKILNLENYSNPIKIKDFNEHKNINNNIVYIFHPMKCL